MKNIAAQTLLIASCLILCPTAKMLAQTQNPASKQSASKTPIWKTHLDAAKSVEDAVSLLREIAENKRETGFPRDFHYHIQDWTQTDVTAFARSVKSYVFFETLLGIGNASVKKEGGEFTKDAIEAQSALAYLKPNSCKSWKGFCNMIAVASDETEEVRHQYHQNINTK